MGGRADVIARSNALETELGASVWSKDFEQATRIADQLQSGVAWVNSHFDVAPNVRLLRPQAEWYWSGMGPGRTIGIL